MKGVWTATLAMAAVLSLCVCATAPQPPSSEASTQAAAAPAESKAEAQEQPKPAATGEQQLAQRLKEYLDNGLRKLDQGAISEGISLLVSVLAESTTSTAALKQKAETELAKVRAGMAMEAGTEWLDENKNQISASSIDVGTAKALSPSIILTISYGGAGKALVTGAPIVFEFVKGGGLLTAFVNTNDYGQSTCNLARLDNPNGENIVRASLVYKEKGFAYVFEGVTKDFVFVPPARRATILVMEKGVNIVSEDPVILDSVYNKLKGVAFDFSQYNGKLLGDEFMKVFGGDPKAIKKLGLEKEVSYLVMVLNDGYNVSQVELAGKKYNIYKSQTTATSRVIRVSDGKIMYSGTVQAVQGQGGTQEKAVLDGFRNAAQAMAEKLDQDLAEISKSLAGTGD